jgi:hypothetical protein
LDREVGNAELSRDQRDPHPGAIGKSRRIQPHDFVALFI